MCDQMAIDKESDAVGLWKKANGDTRRIKIVVCPCICGDRHFGRVAGNDVWIECEREVSDLDIDRAIEADAFPDK